MKLLIIGENGQVGGSLCNLCDENSIEYISTTQEQLDVTDRGTVVDFFSDLDVDIVINATAYTNVELAEDQQKLSYQVNATAIEYFATECKLKDIPFIHISTDYVFDGTKAGMYSEDDVTSPINIYGASKLAGEQALQKIWDKHITLRVSWVFSEFGNNFVKTMLRLSCQHQRLTVVSDQYGSPTSANSIANTILQICKRINDNAEFANWGTYNYTDFPVTTWYQFATYVIDNNSQAITKEIAPILAKDFKTKAKRPQNSAMDTNKIKKVFGIKQNSWMSEVDRVLNILNK